MFEKKVQGTTKGSVNLFDIVALTASDLCCAKKGLIFNEF
jgi:hypothetical protein